MISARDIMSEKVVVIQEDMLMHQVAHLMLRDRVSGFPVVNAAGDLMGIITMTDLFRMIQTASAKCSPAQMPEEISRIKNLPVSEFMSPNVISITPATRLMEIIRLLLEKDIHTFPVIDEGKIAGIVSRHDILNAVFVYET